MYKKHLQEINRQYPNQGLHDEQRFTFTMTGEVRKHDNVPFDKGSDIPEFNMSVKSNRFTLASSNLFYSQDFRGQIEEYFDRVASTSWAFIVGDDAYIMNQREFREMLTQFAHLERESDKNGGGYKIRFPSINKKVMAWLENRLNG